MTTAEIASKLGFTLAELELNRAGQLSAAQSSAAYRNGLFGLGCMLFALALVVFVIGFKPLDAFVRGFCCLILIPGAGVLFYVVGWPALRGSFRPKVLSAEGELQFQGGSRGAPAIVIGKAWVMGTAHAYSVLVRGQRYRIFYLAESHEFLSIERL